MLNIVRAEDFTFSSGNQTERKTSAETARSSRNFFERSRQSTTYKDRDRGEAVIEIFEAAMSDSENSEPEVVQDEEEPMEESEDEEVRF